MLTLSMFYSLWYLPVFFIILVIVKTSWFKGFFGEFLVNFLLSKLPEKKYKLLKNITLPTEDGTTQVDHVLVSRYGIFVIETKNMKGWIYGSEKQKQWTQKIFKKSFKFQNPLHQNYKHLKTLESLLNVDAGALHSVIVFIGDSSFKTAMPDNVTYSRGCLNYIKRYKQELFSESEVSSMVKIIESARFKKGIRTNLKHNEHVKDIIQNKQEKIENKTFNPLPIRTTVQKEDVVIIKRCPRCGSDMVKREKKRGENKGNIFWGCSGFPKCRYMEEK